ncbi:hypothetical protein G647_08249 [Cladophialophora carrionii CBS 160.54]|uniref:HTH La-type RNA-binding domain-containing protein n=1 Tax=Cladophialophora carrionii CBS 160.54 TaxID=1279043 RepID=V9CZY9_9EURO|nr:uncharacterized protein G647_08249 [Cladophialophora carrionii CBS 160.54]ETI20215.1 hypothetical protein G647_08249 [Cladophialophora carrionii CBS 160.54]
MSVEDAVTEGLADPMDDNASAAEEAKRMLAELEGKKASTDTPAGTNGVKKDDTTVEAAPKETEPAAKGEDEPKKEGYDDAEDEKRERREDRGPRDYNDRGHRGGRGDRKGYHDRGRDRGDRDGYKPRNHRENNKFDPTTKEITDDPAEIRKQVEFYFSDSNLPRDKFLFGLVGGIENKPVPLKTLHSFKRMQRFQPFEAIVEALKGSKEVELTDNDTAVRRIKPLAEDFFKVIPGKSDPRTVYVKGFGEETPSSQFDIEAFFDPYGPTKAVRLRRNDEKTFKGSVFVEFETEELAQAFLALDPKPKYKDRDLQIMSKTEYTDKKEADLKAGRITSNQEERRGGKKGHREQRGDRDDDRDWRTRRDEDQKRGFRDDKRRGDRGRGGRGGRGGHGGRPEWRGGGRSKAPETDERGIPSIKSTAPEKDSARDEALAKAKAAVEADMKEQEAQKVGNNVETKDQDHNTVADSGAADIDTSAGKKRAREDDAAEAEVGREVKKVDTKTEPEVTEAES